MEEQVQKQKDRKPIAILCRILFFFSVALLIEGIKLLLEPENPYLLNYIIGFIIAPGLYIFIFILRNRSRKLIIAVIYLIYGIMLLLFQIDSASIIFYYHLSLNNNTTLDIINQVAAFSSCIALFILTFQLLKKALNKSISSVLTIIMGIIFTVSCIANRTICSGEGDFLLSTDTRFVVFGLLYYVPLIIILYISLIKESFYKNFIEAHPNIYIFSKKFF